MNTGNKNQTWLFCIFNATKRETERGRERKQRSMKPLPYIEQFSRFMKCLNKSIEREIVREMIPRLKLMVAMIIDEKIVFLGYLRIHR